MGDGIIFRLTDGNFSPCHPEGLDFISKESRISESLSVTPSLLNPVLLSRSERKVGQDLKRTTLERLAGKPNWGSWS